MKATSFGYNRCFIKHFKVEKVAYKQSNMFKHQLFNIYNTKFNLKNETGVFAANQMAIEEMVCFELLIYPYSIAFTSLKMPAPSK